MGLFQKSSILKMFCFLITFTAKDGFNCNFETHLFQGEDSIYPFQQQ